MSFSDSEVNDIRALLTVATGLAVTASTASKELVSTSKVLMAMVAEGAQLVEALDTIDTTDSKEVERIRNGSALSQEYDKACSVLTRLYSVLTTLRNGIEKIKAHRAKYVL